MTRSMRNDELIADLWLADTILIVLFFRIYTRGRCNAQNRKVTLSTVKKSHSVMGLSKVHVFCVLARDDTQLPKHSKRNVYYMHHWLIILYFCLVYSPPFQRWYLWCPTSPTSYGPKTLRSSIYIINLLTSTAELYIARIVLHTWLLYELVTRCLSGTNVECSICKVKDLKKRALVIVDQSLLISSVYISMY